MDSIDQKILEELQQDSSLSNQDLAERVFLSPSPCSRRVKQLEENGVIRGYVALLEPSKIDLPLTCFVHVALKGHDPGGLEDFEKEILSFPQVVECHLIAGQTADYILKIVVPSLEKYRDFLLKKLTPIKAVSNVHSSFSLSTVKNTTALPLGHLLKP